MYMKTQHKILLWCLGLLLMLSQTTWAQRVSVKIYGTDSIGSDSLVVGMDAAATNNIDAGLGEEEQPVEPPTFDMRSVNINRDGIRDTCLKGLKLNLHKMVRNTQTDEWKIQFQSDDSGTAVTFHWQDRLDTVGGGGWQLIDGSPDIITGPHFQPVDMTTVTSFPYPIMTAQPTVQYVYIKHFDGIKLVTVDAESLINAHDSKNKKVAIEKVKPYHVDFVLTANNTTSTANTKLHLELPGVLVGSFNIGAPGGTAATADAGKGKKWDITLNSAIPAAGQVMVSGTYVGSKAGNISYWWPGLDNKPLEKIKTKIIPPSTLRLPMPNWWNMVYELYLQSQFPLSVNGKPWGLTVGSAPPADAKLGNTVYHPKWGDVAKTMYSKKATHLAGTARCLDIFTTSLKPIQKPQKSLPPDKHSNPLLEEAVALKINLAMNGNPNPKVEHPNIFGNLLYVSGNHPGDDSANGLTVAQISTALDSVLSCRHNGALEPMTFAEVLALVRDINHAFSGTFDTLQWTPKLIMKGVKAVADVPFLYRAAAVVPPVVIAPYKEVKEVPLKYTLDQNYPNPFNPTTTISFTLPQDAFVTLKVYNLLGQEVATLLNREQMSQGQNDVDFDATALSSGVYFYRLIVNDGKFQEVKKMMLLK